MRNLEVWAAGPTTPRERYAHDQAMIARVALGADHACLRVHCAAAAGVALGRFHRRGIGASEHLTRRLTGGRTTPTGPGQIELALAVPAAGWLDPSVATLKPEQILNRALRPFLTTLRQAGVDAFYPGRDLVSVEGSPLAACSFNVLPDGVLFVSICIGVQGPLSVLADQIGEFDPGGIAAIDVGCYEGASALGADAGPGLDQSRWVRALAQAAEDSWRCSVSTTAAEPAWMHSFTAPTQQAYEAFLGERVASPDGDLRTAASMTMLGVVEASASIVDSQIRALEICGDVIAPAMTLSALSEACEGAVAAAPAIRRATTLVLSGQRHFLLGFEGLDELLCRLL